MNTQPIKRGVLTMSAIGAALVPKLVCPFCWPGYAAALSAVGIGFVPLDTVYLLPLTTVLLLVGVAVVRQGTSRRGESWPVFVAIWGAALILSGKFWLESGPLTWRGARVRRGGGMECVADSAPASDGALL